MRINKKRIATLLGLLALIVFFTVRTESYASGNLGPIYVWNSGSEKIGRWSNTSPAIYIKKLNTNGNFSFVSKMNSAVSSWNSALGTGVHTSTSTSSPIKAYGGTSSELAAQGYTMSSDAGGITYDTRTYEGYWMYNNTTPKSGYKITSAVICVKDDTMNNYNLINPCLHELGHGLGWIGHSSVTTDIMYSIINSTTSLTNRDKNHLSQMY